MLPNPPINPDFAVSMIGSTTDSISASLAGGLGYILGIWAAVLSLFFLLHLLLKWLNLPGTPEYDSSRGSHRIGHGPSVKVHSGNMLG